MLFQFWGSTAEEIEGPLVGDEICPDARLVATRSITVAAPPEVVFPWIRQMGTGRGGWYSYDWIDNFGRKSATSINEDWQDVVAGGKVPAGLTSFKATLVDPPRALVLQVDATRGPGRRVCFTLAYELRPDPAGTRLVTRVRSHIDVPGGPLVERGLLGPGDGIMMRRQLLNLAQRVS